MNNSSHPTAVATSTVRIGFGIALALVGIAHYRDAATFAEAVGRGLDFLEPLGMFWGYLLPGLMIVGGVLIALGFFPAVGTLVAGVALVSIPAGLMLKSVLSGISLDQTMPAAMNAIIWILFYLAAVRSFGVCCAVPSASVSKPAPMKVPVVAPKMIAKAPVAKKKKK